MKKIIFKFLFVLGLFSLMSCITTVGNTVYTAPKNPIVIVEYTNNVYHISCTYSGNNWIFLTGVEIKNSNGEIKKFIFDKPLRNLSDYGGVIEIGTFIPAFPEKTAAFLGAGELYARPLAELKTYDFEKIEIINK